MANPLATLNGSINLGITWPQAGDTNSVYGTFSSPTQGNSFSTPFNQGATGGAQTGKQAAVIRGHLAASGAVTIDLSLALTNICGNAGATFTSVVGIIFGIITPIDDAVNGDDGSGISIVPAASDPLSFFLKFNANGATGGTPTGQINLYGGAAVPGDKLGFASSDLNKILVAGGSACKITVTNLDSGNGATYEITLVGQG